ncbi:sporulation delaying protein family toxin [Sporolactobacillus shoreae]|uniref:sporulation delaying protein family toxin n=1 Tax=Sporolactobacillus shoreae TaxID=1465501 RepID=UPI001432DC50|nr:sporulation delaying protein family toxin [Sporolactobacillus shoreae]
MKTKRISVLLLAFCLFFSFSFNSFAEAKSPTDKQNVQQKNSQYSGEELFRGLVFGQGPVAKLFPDIWSSDQIKKANNSTADKVVNLVIKQLKINSPSFFSNFKNIVTSGNPYLIDQKSSEISAEVQQALKDLNAKSTKSTSLSSAAQPDCLWVAGAAVYMYVGGVNTAAVAINVAGAVDIVLWGAIYIWTKGAKAVSPSDQFQREQLIEEMATKLAK